MTTHVPHWLSRRFRRNEDNFTSEFLPNESVYNGRCCGTWPCRSGPLFTSPISHVIISKGLGLFLFRLRQSRHQFNNSLHYYPSTRFWNVHWLECRDDAVSAGVCFGKAKPGTAPHTHTHTENKCFLIKRVTGLKIAVMSSNKVLLQHQKRLSVNFALYEPNALFGFVAFFLHWSINHTRTQLSQIYWNKVA